MRKKNPIGQLFGLKYRKMMSGFSQKDGVKDGHRFGKHQPLSNFHQIMIIILGVNTTNMLLKASLLILWQEKRENM